MSHIHINVENLEFAYDRVKDTRKDDSRDNIIIKGVCCSVKLCSALINGALLIKCSFYFFYSYYFLVFFNILTYKLEFLPSTISSFKSYFIISF